MTGAATFFYFQREQTSANQIAPLNSIAVLPLKNLTNNADNEAFCDGMTESLISALSKIGGLKVISRGSIFAFKNKDTDPREIARKLGVAAILEGSVRESGEKVRVDVRLVNAADGRILWSGDSYDGARGDVFEIQDDISRRVTTQLRLKLNANDEKRLTKRQTNNIEAYQAYLKGRYFWNKKDKENLPKALEFFQEAIRLDPNYALAHAGLSDYYRAGIWYVPLPPKEATEKAKAAAARALELDSQLSDAHLVRSSAACLEWDWETCRKDLERAVELDPNNAQAFHSYAFYLNNVAGRTDDAVAAIKKAQELDPLSVSINTDVGVMLNHAGRYDEAIEAFRKTLEIDSRFNDAYYNLGIAYERKRMMREAADAYLTSWRLKGEREDRLAALQTAFEQSGLEGLRRKNLEFLEWDAQANNAPPFVLWFVLAEYQAHLGERDAAFENLEKSFAAREPYLIDLKSDFAFKSLRSEPQFADLIRRIGLDK